MSKPTEIDMLRKIIAVKRELDCDLEMVIRTKGNIEEIYRKIKYFLE